MYRIGQPEIDAVAAVINSKRFFKTDTELKMVYRVEQQLKGITGAEYSILMTSGTAALISALIGLGIGPGDEVIVPAYTYIASAMAVLAVGAIPVPVEINESCTIDPEEIERNITPQTRAVMPVHIQGFPCDMDAICAIAQKHGLKIVEDACQADGGSYHGRRLATIGDAGAFSFNYYKIVSAGEGGALITNDRQIYERALIYHDASAISYFGDQLKDFSEPVFVGTEYRANEMTAAIMTAQLDRLEGILCDLRRNKKIILDTVGDKYRAIPSNDIEGDCGTTAAFIFDTEAEAKAFEAKVRGSWRPINTGKHVYSNWTFIGENRRGAVNPAIDPFLLPQNAGLRHNYSRDMCPRTLDILSRTVYIGINPDMSEQQVLDFAKSL